MTTRIPTTASSVRRVAAVAVMGAFALSACTAAPDTASPAASAPAVADAASGDTDGAEVCLANQRALSRLRMSCRRSAMRRPMG